ncbi:hypothetical protein J6590_035070, partial [Homalodisca vitripennis]
KIWTEALTARRVFFNMLATLLCNLIPPLRNETISTLKTVDVTVCFVKNVNLISSQVLNMRCHPLSLWKGKTPVKVYNEVITWKEKTPVKVYNE